MLNVDNLTDAELEEMSEILSEESNRRLRIAWFPGQMRQVVLDARTGGDVPDATIREIFEDAMNADID